MKRARRTAPTAGVLPVLALLLLVSAGLRLLGGPAAALARDLAAGVADQAEASAQPIVMPQDQVPEIAALLARLREQKAYLDAREAQIDARAEALKLVENRVATNLAQLEAAERKLAATMIRAETASEDDLVRLTGVYENMKAPQAAELFKRMDPSFAAGFLGRMRPDAAAQIMAGLDPDMAYSISVVLAGRNAEVPVEPVPPDASGDQ